MRTGRVACGAARRTCPRPLSLPGPGRRCHRTQDATCGGNLVGLRCCPGRSPTPPDGFASPVTSLSDDPIAWPWGVVCPDPRFLERSAATLNVRQCLARTSAGRAPWRACSFHLKRTALLGYVPTIDWKIRLLRGVVFIEPSTPPTMLCPGLGGAARRSIVECSPVRPIYPVVAALVQSALS